MDMGKADFSESRQVGTLPDDAGPALVKMIAAGIEASGMAAALFAPDDSIAFLSNSFVELYGVQPQARTFSDIMRQCHASGTGPLFSTDDIEAWLAAANVKRRAKPQRAFEIDMNDGRWFWASEACYAGGWLLLTLVDITLLKVNERTLRMARDAALLSAETDVLTGLYNRRYAMKRLDEQIDHACLSASALSIALVDLDHFKSINDSYGHDAGDQVLQHFAETGRRSMRSGDLLARLGGEEFLLVMPSATARDAYNVLERLRQRIMRSRPISGAALRYTFSAGIVSWKAGEASQQFYRRADMALYAAKLGGRNRVEVDRDRSYAPQAQAS